MKTRHWLPGFAQSRPVRIGNAAHAQFQLDVFGEVLDATHQAWNLGVPLDDNAWRVDTALATYLETAWREPDEGIWEVRGPRRHFTHSKMMAWVAMDRAVKCIEQFKLAVPIDRWRGVRDAIQRYLVRDGFVARYQTTPDVDGLPPGEATFLLCSFWLVDNLELQGRHGEAQELFDRLLIVAAVVLALWCYLAPPLD